MPDLIFTLGGQLALMGWLLLAVSLFVPRIRPWARPVTRLAIPGLLAIAYVWLIVTGRGAFADGGFSSLLAVRLLFAHDGALAAGWVHYLAFDLFVGTWIAGAGERRGLPGWLILPCLPLTFLLGPAGLLLALPLLATRGLFKAEDAL